jgi:hypothetical protein
MSDQPGLTPLSLLARWLVGMGLVSWRYLWSTTPLHRSEERQDEPRTPPPLPSSMERHGLQPWQSGVGPIYHRLFRVRVADPRCDAATLMHTVVSDLGSLVPREVVQVHEGAAADRRLRPGDDIVVDMPGPWNGPVRVVAADDQRLHLATRQGHLEAGQIEFRAYDDPPRLVFEIEAWARPADRAVRLLYSHLRLAKEIQLNMWVRFCEAVAEQAGGRPVDGIEIRTTVTPAPTSAESV